MANLLNSRRHTNSGWKLTAVFPIIKEVDGAYKEFKVQFKDCKLQLFQECMRLLITPIKHAFYNPQTIVCADGLVWQIKLVVASWLTDREEGERI